MDLPHLPKQLERHAKVFLSLHCTPTRQKFSEAYATAEKLEAETGLNSRVLGFLLSQKTTLAILVALSKSTALKAKRMELAERTRIDDTTVSMRANALAGAGIIKVRRERIPGQRQTVLEYELAVPQVIEVIRQVHNVLEAEKRA